VGGLVGRKDKTDGHVWASVGRCSWDIETTGQTTSAGGTSKTTTQMKTAGTFLDAKWDFAGETTNGSEDIWWIVDGQDYPRLSWGVE